MLFPLENGDILIELDSAVSPEMGEKEVWEHLVSKAEHGMVFRHDGYDDRVYHSAKGRFQSGVRSHLLTHAIGTTRALGTLEVLHCKDLTLRHLFSEVVRRWDSQLTKEQLAARPSLGGITRLSTPFIDFFKRDQDSDERLQKHELFRAFRAHMRNHAQSTLPLSKEKGVSCSNFIGYAFKAALIDLLFPKGVPNDIDLQVHVDYLMIKMVGEIKGYPVKKLKDISTAFFDEFNELVQTHIKELPFSDEQKKMYFELLCMPIKGHHIGEFCQFVQKYPELWEFKGHFIYLKEREKSTPLTPYVIDQKGFTAILKEDRKETSVVQIKSHLLELSHGQIIESDKDGTLNNRPRIK